MDSPEILTIRSWLTCPGSNPNEMKQNKGKNDVCVCVCVRIA